MSQLTQEGLPSSDPPPPPPQSKALPGSSYAKSLLSTPLPSNHPGVTATIAALSLQPHPEGGFFVETDRDPLLIPNPFLSSSNTGNGTGTSSSSNSATTISSSSSSISASNSTPVDGKGSTTNLSAQGYNAHLADKAPESPFRHASTSIHYFLTPSGPLGRFHRNKARTVHTLHWGRGAYVVLHPPVSSESETRVIEGDEEGRGRWRVETFIVGKDVVAGEKVQWIVEGGRFKASYLLPDEAQEDRCGDGGDGDGEGDGVGESGRKRGKGSQGGLLISETVVPGFEYSDHDFLTAEGFKEIVPIEGWGEMGWLLGREEGRKLMNV